MDEIVKAILYVIFFPGLLFTASIGLFLCWVDRKITARIQSRIGPPWYQCYADVLKLLCKTMIIPKGSQKWNFLLAPLLGLSGVTLTSTIIWMVNLHPETSFVGDLIVFLYLLTLPSLALIIGGSSSQNPFGAIGASREMKMILAYELPFLLSVFTVIIKTKSIILGDITQFQKLHGILIQNPSCIIALIASIPCIQAKLGYLPFDIPEAETEIMGGVLIEYSGTSLALLKITNAMMLFTLPISMMTLFMGGIHFTIKGMIVSFLEFLGILILIVLIKSTHPRLRIDQTIRFFWWIVTPFAVIGIILAIMGA